MNATNQKFIQSNQFDINGMRGQIDCNLYPIKVINHVFGEFYYTFTKKSQETSACIGDIVGTLVGNFSTAVEIFDIMDDYFDKYGDGYHSRSVSLLELDRFRIVEQLNNSFTIEPIHCLKLGEGEKRVISINGMHRYTILRLWYLKELYEANGDIKKIEEIRKKYTIPVKSDELDVKKIYYAYLIKIAQPYPELFSHFIGNVKENNGEYYVEFRYGFSGRKFTYFNQDEYRGLLSSVNNISQIYDEKFEPTGDIKITHFDGSNEIVRESEIREYFINIFKNCPKRDEIIEEIKRLYELYGSFREFFKNEKLFELLNIRLNNGNVINEDDAIGVE